MVPAEMRKVKIIKTGEVKLVSNNQAHDLIEAGVAKLYTGVAPKRRYKTRVMQPRSKKRGYRIK